MEKHLEELGGSDRAVYAGYASALGGPSAQAGKEPSLSASPSEIENESLSADAPHWAQPVARFKVSDVPTGAVNLNVEGRQIVGPLQGFGQLWQKTYRVRLPGVSLSPAQVMDIRTFFYKLAAPLRWIKSLFKRRAE